MQKNLALLSLLLLSSCGLGEMLGSKSGGGGGPTALGIIPIGTATQAQIEVHAMEPTINEGKNARFRIGWYGKGPEPESDLTVNLSVTQTGDFSNTDLSSINSITLTKAKEFTDVLEIPTSTDSIVEYKGKISVELLPGVGYTIYDYEKRQEISPREATLLDVENPALQHVNVIDNSLPRIDIVAQDQTISEGGIARFTLGWYGFGSKPKPGLTVNLSVRQTGNFTNTFPLSLTLTGESGDVLEIPTIDDSIAESNGSINVRLLPGTGYNIYNSNVSWSSSRLFNWGSTFVEVFDNDQPRISISPVHFSVIEGNPARFVIKSETTAPARDLTVNISTFLVGDFFTEPPPTTFVLKAGKQSDILSIPTIADTNTAKNGAVQVGIKPGSGYVTADLKNKYTTVGIVGDNVPSVWAEAVKPTVIEGGVAEFKIGRELGVLDTNLEVNILITKNGGGFLDGNDIPTHLLSETFLLTEGNVSGKLALSTVDDNLSENDWRLGLQIQTGNGYQMSGRRIAYIDIIDDDLPVWVESSKSEIYEGDAASFLVGIGTGDSPQIVDRIVNLNVSQTGNFIAGDLPGSVKLRAGKSTEVLEFPTVYDDSSASGEGSITVNILPGTYYAVADRNSATITVKDRESQPVPTLLVAADREEIEEGQPVLFRIVTDVSRLASPLTVHFETELQGDFLDQVHTEPLPRTFKLDPGRTFLGRVAGTHGYSTEDDQRQEAHGSITITLQDSDEYKVLKDHGSATVRIRDNDGSNFTPDDEDSKPRIGISSVLSSVVYGLELPFSISSASNKPLPEGLTITVNVRQIYALQETYQYSREIVLDGNQQSEEFYLDFVPTNFNVQPDGAEVEVTIAKSVAYDVLAGRSKASTLVVPKSVHEYSIFGFGRDVDHVSEGEIAEIPVTISNSTVGFIVRMRATQTGEFLDLDLEEGLMTVFVPPNLPAKAFMPIPIPENDTYEGDGSVTFEILPGFGYHVDHLKRTTTLHILDNDKPEVFVESAEQHVYEGEQAVFAIGTKDSAFAELGSELEIFLRITHQGDFLVNSPPESFTVPTGQHIGYLRLDTIDNSQNEANGSVAVEIDARDGSYYSIRQGFGQATVEIRDNDPDWLVTMNKLGDFVFEGDSADFEISRDGTDHAAEIEIFLKVSAVGNFLLNAPPESFILPAGKKTHILSIQTRSNELIEPNGQVSVEILPGSGYKLRENEKPQTIEVLDSSQTLPVFVAKLNYFVNEGESANFIIGSEDAPAPRDLEILLEVSDPSGFLSKEAPESFSLKKGMHTGNLELETEDDKIIEADDWISVRILPGAGYQPMADSSADRIKIRDNEPKPNIHVRALSQTALSGENAEFEIGTTGEAPISDLKIGIWVERQIGQFSYGSYVNLVLTKNKKVDVFRRSSSVGQITVTVLSGTGYTVSETESSATVNFVTKPTIYVDEDSYDVVEGQPVSFRIGRKYSSTMETTVNIKVSQFAIQYPDFTHLDLAGKRNLLEESPPESVVIPESQEFVTLTLNTIDDNINGYNDVSFGIKLEILNGTGYKYFEGYGNQYASVGIIDNDPNPELSIEALRTEVGKGDTARFRVVATIASYDDLLVGLELGDSGNLTVGPAVTGTVLEAGTKFVEFDVSTDENASSQGHFNVYLQQANEYEVDDQLHTATVRVYDWPLIGVEPAQETPLTEGGQAAFRLISRENRPVPLNVGYTVSQSAVSETRPLTESFSAGLDSQTFLVSTVDNDVYTHDSRISVELQPGHGYRVSKQYHPGASISFTDNDKPTISVESKLTGGISEGDSAVFAVNATNTSSTDLQVNLIVEDSRGSFLLTPRSTATLPAGKTSAHFSVQTYADTLSDSDGRVTVEVVEGLGYDVASPPSSSAGIDVANVARPLLFLVRDRHSVRIGEDAVFTVKAVTTTDNGSIRSISLANDLIISVGKTWSNNLHSISGFETWTLPAGQASMTKRIPTGYWTSIAISLIAYSNGTYGLYERYGTAATVTVTGGTDNGGSAAPVSISISGSNPVVEGTGRNPVFRLTADRPATSDLTVNLAVTGALNFVEIGSIPESVVLKAGSEVATMEIPIHDDNVDDADGEIMVEILTPAAVGEYVIGAPGSAKVGVKDDETPPTVSIAGSANAVEGPGVKAVFTVTASKTASTDRNINLSVSGAEDFLSTSGMPKLAVLSSGETTATIELEIDDDEIDESSDVLTVAILPPAYIDDYWVGDDRYAETTIEDNDSDLLVTIASDGDAVEGPSTNLTFTVTARRAETFERTIGLTLVKGASGFIDTDNIPSQINLPANSTSVKVEIPMDNDDVDEAEDTFRIKITPSSSGEYEVLPNNVALATISDDDLPPIISIKTPEDHAEGTDENVTIEFQATGRASVARVINLSITGADSYFQPGSIPASVTLPPLSTRTHIDIPIHDDDDVEDLDGTLSIEILPPSTSGDYSIGATGTASLNLTDSVDSNPSMSISDAETVVEGTDSNASFTLTSSKTVAYLRQIDLSVAGAMNFVDTANLSSYVNLPANSSTTTFELPIHDDDVDEDAGSISVSILAHSDTNPGRAYTVGSPSTGTVRVSDNDDPPALTIAGAYVVAEGGGNQVLFTVTASRMAESDRTVRILVSDPADVVEIESNPESVTLSRKSLTTIAALPIDAGSVSPEDTVSMQILPPETPAATSHYSVGSPDTATVNVSTQAAVPQITISNAPAVTEGTDSHAIFPIAVTHALTVETTINVSITGATSFIGPGSVPATVTIPIGRLNTTLEIPIHDDNVDEANGTINVSIPDHSANHFTIGEANTANVSVADNDNAPRISISVPSPDSLVNGKYIEGTHSKAVITLKAEGVASTSRRINVGVSKLLESMGDFFPVGSFTTSATLNALSDSTTLDLNILDDNIEENEAIYLVNILPPTNDEDYLLGTRQYYMRFGDDDGNPEMSISAGDDAVEGTDSHAVFTIKSSKLTNASRQVNLSVTGATNYLAPDSVPTNMEFPSGEQEATLRIPIHDDNDYESDGTINVEIAAHSTAKSYRIGTPNSASVNVSDNDSPPLISITGPASFVEGSGSHIEFTLSANVSVTSDLTVRLSVTGTEGFEGFLAPNDTFPSSAVFAFDKLHSPFLLPIHDDEVEENSSIITVTVSPPGSAGGYAVGTPGDAEVHVLDDESTSDWPVVSIAPNHELQTFVEGTDSSIDFTLHSSKRVQSGLDVKVSVTGATGFLSSIPRSIRFSSGIHKNFSLRIQDDNVYDDPGSITVTVLGPFINGGYLVSNQKSAQAAIRDNDSKPVISVLHADRVAVVGLNSFIHVLYKSNKKSSSPRTVNLSVTGALNFLVADSIPDSFEFPAHRTNYTLQIPVIGGDVEESKGEVTVTILEPTNSEYSVGLNKEVSTDVLNGSGIERPQHFGLLQGSANDGSSNTQESLGTLIDDQPYAVPVASISTKLPVIQEGSIAEFQISVSQEHPADLTINLTIDMATGSNDGPLQDTVAMKSGEKTVSFAIPTHDNRLAGEDWTVTVGIASGDHYQPDSEANVATVRVSDETDRTRRDAIVQANSVVLPALLERTASGPLSTAFHRVEQSFAGNTQALKVGGQDSLKDMIFKVGKLANDSEISWDSLLEGSSFNIPINDQYGNSGDYSVWGAGERHNASQRQESFRWNGDLLMGQLGFDAQFNEEYMAGLSVTLSEAEATYESSEASVLEYDTESTGLYPYFGWESFDRNTQLKVAAGYSEGGIVVNQDGFKPYFMDSTLFSAGIGGNASLFSTEGELLERTTELNLVGEAWFARQDLNGQYGYLEDRRLETGHSRVAVESANQFDANAGASFHTTTSIGVLGKSSNGFGFELGSSLSYVNPIGLNVSAEGRSFLAADGQARDISLSGKAEFDLEGDSLGLILSVSPVWARSFAGSQSTIWSSEVSEFGSTPIQFGTSSQFNANIGFGIDLWNQSGVLTPFGEVRLSEGTKNEFAIGSRFESDSGLEFGLEWSGSNSFDSDNTHTVKANSGLKW